VITDTYLSVGTRVQQALPRLLPLRQRIQQPVRQRTGANMRLLQERMGEMDGVRLLQAEGGWYAIVEAPIDAEALALELLQTDGVLVHPGFFYDFATDGYLVLSLLSPDLPAGLEPLLARLRDCS
jgi:alanine-synthesizing transaminase